MISANKKVSIIIPCYNKEKYVSEAIESALAQTYDNLEVVIVNDGSTDNSCEIISKYADKYRNIIFFDENINKGVVASRNLAINAATGDYILPLDADDTIEPTYVEEAAKILDERENIGIVYCDAKKIGIINRKWKLPEFNKEKMLYQNCIFCSAMFRKSNFIKVGGYKEYMNVGAEDWDLWLSFIENDYEVYKINKVLFNYRQLQEKSRKNETAEKYDSWKAQIIKNHINLYLNSTLFLQNVVINATEIREKYKKYKKLFNIFISLCGFLFIMILLILFLEMKYHAN